MTADTVRCPTCKGRGRVYVHRAPPLTVRLPAQLTSKQGTTLVEVDCTRCGGVGRIKRD